MRCVFSNVKMFNILILPEKNYRSWIPSFLKSSQTNLAMKESSSLVTFMQSIELKGDFIQGSWASFNIWTLSLTIY